MADHRRRSRYTKEQILAMNKKKLAQKEEALKGGGKWHWYLTLHIIGLILIPVNLLWICKFFIISYWEIALIVLGIGLMSAVLQFNYLKKKKVITHKLKFTTPLFLSYNILGIGFIGLTLFFILNFSLASDELIIERHRIVGTDPEYKIVRWRTVVFLLEDDVFSSDVSMRVLPFKNYYTYKKHPYMEYVYKKGFFGYKVKIDHYLEKNPQDAK